MFIITLYNLKAYFK